MSLLHLFFLISLYYVSVIYISFAHNLCFFLTSLFGVSLCIFQASQIAHLVKNPPAMQETPVRFLGREDPLEKG